MVRAFRDRLVAIQRAQLAQDVAEVKIRRALGDTELDADIGAGHAVRSHLQALTFARRERRALLRSAAVRDSTMRAMKTS